MRKIYLIFAILIAGLFIRIYKINETPLYGDELTMAYDTYSIARTGRDQTGELLPLTFKMGAGRPGGYIYASVPFVAIFGPSALGIRFVSVLSGLGIIVLVYLLGKKIFDEKVAVFAAFLAAIAPWDIYLSRGGFEAHLALFFALAGIVSFLYGQGRPKLYLVWALSWGFAIHTYPTYKLTLPLIFIALILYSKWKSWGNKMFVAAACVLSLFVLLVAREAFVGKAEERFLSINIFSEKGTQEAVLQETNLERAVSTFPKGLRFVLSNRVLAYSQLVTDNYFRNVSYEFLFLNGDGNPRHNPGEMGMLYLLELPLFFFVFIRFWSKEKRTLIFLLSWILIVPLATMLLGNPHGLRNSLMIPAFLLISAYGLSNLPKRMRQITIIVIFIQLVVILNKVYFIAPSKFADFWSYPAKKAVEIAEQEKSKYDFVYLSDQIDNVEYAYPVYTKTDPNRVIEQYGNKTKQYGNVIIADIDKVGIPEGRVLVIANAKKVGDITQATDVIDSLNLEPALALYDRSD